MNTHDEFLYSFDCFKCYFTAINFTIHIYLSRVMRKPDFCIYAKTKTQISCVVTAQLISAFVFAIRIVQSLYYLNAKFKASSHLLRLQCLPCVGPGRKPRRPVFSRRGSFDRKQDCHGWKSIIYSLKYTLITHANHYVASESILYSLRIHSS